MASIAGLRYIIPLFELARDHGALEEVGDGLRAFRRLLRETPELESALLDPRVPAQKKKGIIRKLTEGGMPPLLRDFLCLLVDKKRERVFLFMDQEFDRLLRESKNIVTATVETPVSLSGDLKEGLVRKFEAFTGKSVELTEKLNPDLIAGIRILLGTRMIDGSLKARLEGMRRHLKQGGAAKAG